jgi:glycerol-3-phosphate acyltransferase PlsY
MNIYLLLLISTFISYLLASFPSGVIISQSFFKKDIRTLGSGNTGVTNVGRMLGWKAGLAVLILDLSKSIGGPLIAYFLTNNVTGELATLMPSLAVYLAGLGTALGHSYPIFANFKGGKAVSSLGGFLLTTNWLIAIVTLTYFLIFVKIKKWVSVGSMTGAVLSILLSLLYWFIPDFTFGMWPYVEGGMYFTFTLVLLTLLLIYRHKDNILRLAKGKENKVKW